MATTETALASEVNITLHAGNHVPIVVTVTGSDGVAVTLTSWTAEFIVSRDLVVELKLTTGAGIEHYPATPAVDVLRITLAADDTRLFDGGYDYELKVMSPGGDEETAMYGRITFIRTADRE